MDLQEKLARRAYRVFFCLPFPGTLLFIMGLTHGRRGWTISGACLVFGPMVLLIATTALGGMVQLFVFAARHGIIVRALVAIILVNLANIVIQFPAMLIFLPFGLASSIGLLLWLVSVLGSLKSVYYKVNGTVVQVKNVDKRRTKVNEEAKYYWTGEYKVNTLLGKQGKMKKGEKSNMLSSQDKQEFTKEGEDEECTEGVQTVRKVFKISSDLYEHSSLQAYVIVSRPKDAVLVKECNQHFVLALILIPFWVCFAFPGLVIPLTLATDGDLFECSCGLVGVSYLSIMGSSILIWLNLVPVEAFGGGQSGSGGGSQENRGEGGEQELPMLDMMHDLQSDDETTASVESSFSFAEVPVV